MTFENYEAAVKPKVHGSWNLHALLPPKMDFFILLSSIAGVLGSRSQSNYASGNTYQDALARHRNSIGEKAVSLDVGMMLDVGLVAENPDVKEAMDAAGFFAGMTELELHALLDYYCNPALGILPPLDSQVVMGIQLPDATAVERMEHAYWIRRRMFNHLRPARGTGTGNGSDGGDGVETDVDLGAMLGKASSTDEAASIVCDALVQKLAKTLSTSEADLDKTKPIHHYGVDSLVAVELRNWCRKKLDADVAIFDIMSGASIAALGSVIVSKSRLWNGPAGES